MKRELFAAVILSIMLVLSGCGGGGSSPPPPIVTQILSTPAFDGDIERDLANNFFVTQGSTPSNPSVLAGIDPGTGSEFRAFLNFPLSGTNGVPGNAFIESAKLDIFIDSINLLPVASAIPIRIELVSFTPPDLVVSDFDRSILPPLEFIRTTVLPSDVLHHVTIDVTRLMAEAQRRGHVDFQIRILEDDGFTYEGSIEINDTTVARAPLLEVTYSF